MYFVTAHALFDKTSARMLTEAVEVIKSRSIAPSELAHCIEGRPVTAAQQPRVILALGCSWTSP